MAETFNFSVQGLLPTNTKAKSKDPVGNDINAIVTDFAKLLIAQIQNQDPDKPQDITETVTQYSQMLATLGQVKANNATIQFGEIQIGKDSIGKTVSYSLGTAIDPNTRQLVENLRTGVVTGVDFSGETPSVTIDIDGSAVTVEVDKIRKIYEENQINSLQKGALIVGKTVDYVKDATNPAYVDSITTPNEPQTILQTFSGIVTAVDYATPIPTAVISGETDPISLTKVVKIQG